MLKREKIQRTTEQIEYMMERINTEFLHGHFVKIEFENGHWLTMHEFHDTHPIEYCLKLDDNRLIWTNYKELSRNLHIQLANPKTRIFDEDGYELKNYYWGD